MSRPRHQEWLATHCAHCGLPGRSHVSERECIAALRDQMGSMELAAEARNARSQRVPARPTPSDPRRRTYLLLLDQRKPTLGHILGVLQEQYQIISALEERVRILDAERTGHRSNLLAFPAEDRA